MNRLNLVSAISFKLLAFSISYSTFNLQTTDLKIEATFQFSVFNFQCNIAEDNLNIILSFNIPDRHTTILHKIEETVYYYEDIIRAE